MLFMVVAMYIVFVYIYVYCPCVSMIFNFYSLRKSSSLTLLSTEVGFDFFSCTYKRPYSVTSPSGEKRNVSDQSFYLFNFQCQLDENSEPISNEFDSSLEVVNPYRGIRDKRIIVLTSKTSPELFTEI